MSSKTPQIEIARAYDVSAPEGEYRVLVDRLWPRGVKKESLALDQWCKDLAPSTELRHWFNHQPERWEQFRERYFGELKGNRDAVDELLSSVAGRRLLLIYGARDEQHNNAIALREFLLAHSSGERG